jgi:hypothetical protein
VADDVDLEGWDVQACVPTRYDGGFPGEVWDRDRGIVRHAWIVDAVRYISLMRFNCDDAYYSRFFL